MNRTPLIVAIVLLLLPILYVGSYLALVRPGEQARLEESIAGGIVFREFREDYRWGAGRVAWLYWPLEQIDRKLRPRAWQPFGHVIRQATLGENLRP